MFQAEKSNIIIMIILTSINKQRRDPGDMESDEKVINIIKERYTVRVLYDSVYCCIFMQVR